MYGDISCGGCRCKIKSWEGVQYKSVEYLGSRNPSFAHSHPPPRLQPPPYHAAAVASLSPGGCRSRAISPPFFRHTVVESCATSPSDRGRRLAPKINCWHVATLHILLTTGRRRSYTSSSAATSAFSTTGSNIDFSRLAHQVHQLFQVIHHLTPLNGKLISPAALCLFVLMLISGK